MRYLGGKSTIFPKFKDIVLTGWGTRYKWYIEPFVGGSNSMQLVPPKENCRRIGYDINPFLIALFQAAQNFQELRFVSRDEYSFLRTVSRLPEADRRLYGVEDWEIGMAGFLYSYRGDFFQGYAGDSVSNSKKIETNAESLIRSFNATMEKCLDVYYETMRFEMMPIQTNCIYYLDPPYAGTREYTFGKIVLKERTNLNLNWYELFWEKARRLAKSGNAVYVSEFTAPSDFVCIWEGEKRTNMDAGTSEKLTMCRKSYEKLFIYGG